MPWFSPAEHFPSLRYCRHRPRYSFTLIGSTDREPVGLIVSKMHIIPNWANVDLLHQVIHESLERDIVRKDGLGSLSSNTTVRS